MFNKKSSSTASAKVVDGNLIISLPDAKNPIVWRMALGEARAAALEVRELANDFVLVLKYPKGDTTEIAPFHDRQTATNALMAVSDAMQQAHGHIQSAPVVHGAPTYGFAPQSSLGWKWMIPFALILIAIFLFTRTSATVPVDYASDPATGGSA